MTKKRNVAACFEKSKQKQISTNMAETKKSDCDCLNQWDYLEIARAKGPDGSRSIMARSIREKKPHEWIANQVISQFESELKSVSEEQR